MSFELPYFSGITYVITGFAAALVVVSRLRQGPNLDAFPAVGASRGLLGTWWVGVKNRTEFTNTVREGCEKYMSAPFKVSQLGLKIVVLSNRNHVGELLKAADDVVSMKMARNEQLNTMYTFGPDLIKYHEQEVTLIRSKLTRSLAELYPEIREECAVAIDEILNLIGREWKSVPMLNTFQQIIARINNRIFVGLPLCRDPTWTDLNVRFSNVFIKEGVGMGLFPKYMKPLAACFFASGTRRGLTEGLEIAGPTAEERLKYFTENDHSMSVKRSFVLVSRGIHAESNIRLSVAHVMLLNIVSIQTSSFSIINALFRFAMHPHYVQPLREEVESIVSEHGWSKDSLEKMCKLDSFLKECQRLNETNVVGILRKALKDIVFSDGTLIPQNTLIGIATRSMNCGEESYEDANTFKPFRFVDMANKSKGAQFQFTSTAIDYLAFGLGRHTCPGRFLAATELKTMLAHIVMTYDVKLEHGSESGSHNQCYSPVIATNPHATLMFRNRVD